MRSIEVYLSETMGDLRHPDAAVLPDDDRALNDPAVEAAREEQYRRAREYAQALVEDHQDQLENFDVWLGEQDPEDWQDRASAVASRVPSMVTTELSDVARQVRELEVYLKRLVVFAHRFAVEDLNQSELSRLTGATRVTISRWLNDESLSKQVAQLAAANASIVISRHTPGEIRDRETAAALGVLHWYASAVPTDEDAPGADSANTDQAGR